MRDPILPETGSHVTATFNPQLGVVVEIMGLGRVSRMILNPKAARELAEQLDFAALTAPRTTICACPHCACTITIDFPGAHPVCADCQLGDHQP